MDAVKLYKKYSIDELQKLDQEIRDNQENQLVGEFYLYTKKARKKLEAISWAITYHLKDLREARGEKVSNGAGYTGRKSNRQFVSLSNVQLKDWTFVMVRTN